MHKSGCVILVDSAITKYLIVSGGDRRVYLRTQYLIGRTTLVTSCHFLDD